ncbi:serine-rich adhesin for platelets isoform X2 [Daktulosphaira vitifoliae]|uniref:serine-rich adhesin for platelets isoform X2 n=1 Tax=Daktulosphaira vitifoliae TaxID=58002 RepID=UPI0021A9E4B6|nr:serine-rich adhesin for platelets isoform X2 [Daktulosphaira vitifoliae]
MQISQWLLIFVLIIITDAEHNIQKRDSSNKKKIVCYYTNWSVYRPGTAKFSPQNINPYLCTHLIYAFGGLDKENGLKPYDKYQDIEQGGYAKFNGLKTYNKNLKTLLAIGGWNEGSTRFSKLVADEDRRKEFVKNVVKFLRQNNFDGLDLDWEYPSFRDGSNPSDKENYALLVKELREEFNKESSKTGRSRLLLTMAVPAGIEYIDKGYDIPELNKYLDFMNLLTYDYHSAYEPAVNHHSPLYPLEEDSEYNFDAKLNIDHTIKHYLDSGADKDKLVLGIPTYGRSYTLFNKESTGIGAPSDGPGEKGEATREKGYLSYYEICGSLKKDDKWTVEQPKPRAMGPYAYKDNQWVGYDDEEFVKLKAKYVNEHELGGIMFWSIDNDDFRGSCHKRPYPLIEAGKSALLGNLKVDSTLTKETKTPLKQRPKQRPISRSTTTESEEISSVSTTPEPPTTPDSGTDFTCKEEGFFPHPRECKKYFWCLDSGPSNLGIVAHQFTCPSGLVFNKLSDSCDYSRNVICKDKITTSDVTTITTTTSTSKPIKSGLKITTTTTTTSTQAPEIEEEVDSEFEEEDPKEIKQLITLIKKLGGVAELEKQLNLKDGDTEVTTPTISKTLYNKVLKNPANRFQSRYVNGPGPQSNGLEVKDDTPDYKKDKPQYVTIRRQRPSKDVEEENLNVEDANSEHDVTTEQTKLTYKSVDRNRYRDLEESSNKNEENDSIPKYISINQSRSTESDSQDTTSPKYVTLRRSRPTTQAEESIDEETSLTTLPSTSSPKYVSLLRQRSTTTPSKHEERVIEVTTIKEEDDEIRDIITTPKVSEETITNEPILTSTKLPITTLDAEIDISTVNYSTTISNISETIFTTQAPIPTTMEPISLETTIASTTSTSTITNVITSIYEAATERQRVRIKNIPNFLSEHKKSELDKFTIEMNKISTTTPKVIENNLMMEESTQKSILKGRFRSQTHPRPTLRKPTEPTIKITTTEKVIDTVTEKKSRLNKYTNRFFRPSQNNTEESTTTPKRFIRPTTETYSSNITKQYGRFRSNTVNNLSTSTPSIRRGGSRFRSSTTEAPTSSNTVEVKKSRFFRSRKPTTEGSTTTYTTESKIINDGELLNTGENVDRVRYDSSTYDQTTYRFTSRTEKNFEHFSSEKNEFRETTINDYESYKTNPDDITTLLPSTTNKMYKIVSRGSVKADDTVKYDIEEKPRRTSSGRQNSRFLKDEQKVFFIKIKPTVDGRSQNEFISEATKNVTRNRGRVRAFDSLELYTLSDGLTNKNRQQELFKGSETKFTARQLSVTNNSTEEIRRDRNRFRGTRPPIRTTTAVEEPQSSTESYVAKVNRRRKFRPEYTTVVATTKYSQEEPTTIRSRRPEQRRIKNRTTTLKNIPTTIVTPETVAEDSKQINDFLDSSSQPFYDESSFFSKNRDDRKIGGPVEDLANTAVAAIHTLATAPPSTTIYRSSTSVPEKTFFQEPQHQELIVPRLPHSKDNVFNLQNEFTKSLQQQPQQQTLQQLSPSIKLSESLQQQPPKSFQPVASGQFHPSPFQSGPFQPIPFSSDVSFSPPPVFAPQQPTTPLPATSRQTFLLRRGPSRTTPLIKFTPTTARSLVPVQPIQFLNDGPNQEQFADYSEQSNSGEQVALKGKVRIHADGYIECLDMGSFPHPFSCQKFISCSKTEYGSLIGWEYTCPKGLSFDPVGGICNWSNGCNN